MDDIYRNEGYFHIESFLNPGLIGWTKDETAAYADILEAITVLGDVELVFWLIHPRGVGLILRKTPDITYSQAHKLDALERIGEGKLAARWSAQSDQRAKPIGAMHTAKLDYLAGPSQNLANIIKTFKQRISVDYNRSQDCAGCIWRDRAKTFHLPDDAAHLSEVAAFILVQAQQQNKMGATIGQAPWPTPAPPGNMPAKGLGKSYERRLLHRNNWIAYFVYKIRCKSKRRLRYS